jgi:predicted membrane-bound mannosyltransferase
VKTLQTATVGGLSHHQPGTSKESGLTVRPFWHEERLSVLVIAAFFFMSRLLLIGVNEAEFSDGYLILQWSFSDPVRWHPIYPLLVQGFGKLLEPVIAGRIVSSVAGCLTLIPLALLTSRLYGAQAATAACILFTTSPLMLWINLRMLSESVFILFALWSIYFLVRWFEDAGDRDLPLFTFFSGLALLTRPDGLILAPLFAIACYSALRKRRYRALLLTVPATVPHICFLLWMRFANVRESYPMAMKSNMENVDWQQILSKVAQYIEIFPYVSFYPVFVMAILGVIISTRIRRTHWKWLWIVLSLQAGWLAMLSIHQAWSTRFLVMPLTLVIILAGASFGRLFKRHGSRLFLMLLLVTSVLSLIFAGVAVYLQTETFSDVRNAALFIRKQPPTRIFSDEIIKTAYYSDVPLEIYKQQLEFRRGDLILLHSFYTDLPVQVEFLKKAYSIDFLFHDEATTVPILACGILSTNHLTNSIAIMQQRFESQKSQSVVVKILAVRNPPR